jgi:hypothetical protein
VSGFTMGMCMSLISSWMVVTVEYEHQSSHGHQIELFIRVCCQCARASLKEGRSWIRRVSRVTPTNTKKFHKMAAPSPPPDSHVETVGESSAGTSTFSLENILGDNHSSIECPDTKDDAPPRGWDEEEMPEQSPSVPEEFCVECEGFTIF